MNWLDYVIAFLLALGVYRSTRRGFSREVIGLAATIIGIVLAMWFYGVAGSLLSPWISSPQIANMVGFLLVLMAVILIGAVIGWIIHRFLKTVGLSFVDHLLGALFGLARGIVILIALLVAWVSFGAQGEGRAIPAAVVHSRIAPYILEAGGFMVAAAPMELKQTFRKQYTQVDSVLKKAAPKSGGQDL